MIAPQPGLSPQPNSTPPFQEEFPAIKRPTEPVPGFPTAFQYLPLPSEEKQKAIDAFRATADLPYSKISAAAASHVDLIKDRLVERDIEVVAAHLKIILEERFKLCWDH